MLRRLEIENYGLIGRAQIEFAGGATVFTGETGSGKTMILGALGFVLGARASADVVRRGSPRASVTLTFEPDVSLRELLAADGFDVDDGEDASFAREITEAGKSTVRVNGRTATAGYVRELAPRVAELIGQHEAQRLLVPAYHMDLLDRFGGASATRDAVAAAHERASACARELAELASDERRAWERYEDARFAFDEIASAALETGEDERISERARVLENVEHIAAALRTAHEALAGDDDSATNALGAAAVSLSGIAALSADLAAMAAAANALQSEANDLAASVSRALDATEFDPGELETINARLDTLERLKRKYGGSLEAVVAHGQSAEAIIRSYEARDEHAGELRAKHEHEMAHLRRLSAALTQIRSEAAAALRTAVEREFSDLALASGRFAAALAPRDEIGVDGAESVEFLFAANQGEPLRPLARVASGGELSRVLLALVVALAQLGERTALVFDEIDSGIGGATATAVGARLGRLARAGQVVCVTHLAQLATWADRHYVLEKHERDGATTIGLREIAGEDARAAELARMLSGESHDVAIEHARSLLRAAAVR
jgi:DNA repair protein RecN (Recombination protein N)